MIWRLAYTLSLWAALPVVLARLYWRSLREPVYRERLGERFGRYGPVMTRPVGKRLVWLHAVSLGEVHAAKPLVDRLLARHPDTDFLLTQMTAAGRQAARQLLGQQVQIVWLPYDFPFAVRSFLKRFRPDLGIIVETEVWFNLIEACHKESVPVLLANARLSERSFLAYQRIAPLASKAFASITEVAAQTSDDANRLMRLGARSVCVAGNLKFDVEVSPDSQSLAREFRARFGSRRILLVASTREGEEALILDALAGEPLPGVLTLIVPRHPQRFADVAAMLERRGLRYVRRSANRDVPDDCHYVLGDSVGEMGAYYRAADIAFIGGSLLDTGAQNFIEACAAGIPVLIGPSVYNFALAAELATSAGAALRVEDAAGMVECAAKLLEDPAACRAMGDAGLAFCARHRGAAARMAEIATKMLESRP